MKLLQQLKQRATHIMYVCNTMEIEFTVILRTVP